MTDHSSPEKSPWGWKALIIFCILGALFLGIFWLAVNNEPDYMPSQQKKDATQQHAFKKAPVMSEEAIQQAQADKAAREQSASGAMTAEEMHMSSEQHAQMEHTGTEHNPSHEQSH